ncbi:MAG TPA: peptide-binding protein, partial [Methyloradius sp.]|nr:peptide-binding protein [Methyloradius sp.]
MLLTSVLLNACSKNATEKDINYDVSPPTESGGTLVDATAGEPSGLIAMIAGESAASAVAANLFNSLLKYDKNLELQG